MRLPVVLILGFCCFIWQIIEMLTGSMSQHGGLLHQSSNGEKDLHALHGRIQRSLHFHVRLRNVLSGWKTHCQTGEDPPGK